MRPRSGSGTFHTLFRRTYYLGTHGVRELPCSVSTTARSPGLEHRRAQAPIGLRSGAPRVGEAAPCLANPACLTYALAAEIAGATSPTNPFISQSARNSTMKNSLRTL